MIGIFTTIYASFRLYINGGPPPVATNHILLEDGDGLLLENGFHLTTE